MKLDGLITVSPDQKELIGRLSDMMGESFLEERWTQTWLECLDGLGTSRERKLEISRAIMLGDFTLGSEFQCCYATEDEAACAGGYLKSELGDRKWVEFEGKAFEQFVAPLLSPEEERAMTAREHDMTAISVFDWAEGDAESRGFGDFIHFYAYGVDTHRRHSGAFRRLVDPFFAFADEQGIPCYLEAYREDLVSLYSHFGYETVRVLSDPKFEAKEYCMVRLPR